MQMSSIRSRSGQSMPLVVVCALILIICAVAAINIGMVLSGSQQVRNAVDAGALNIAAHAVDVKLQPPLTLSDVADSTGQIGMTNINRAIGKTFLINLNAESMQKSGQAGQSQGNAQSAVSDLETLSQQLAHGIKDQTFLSAHFNSMLPNQGQSKFTEARVAGSKAPQFATSYVHSGQTSNIIATANQLPAKISFNGQGALPGYKPLPANGQSMYFVPFKTGEKPHLISTDEFQANRQSPAGWQAPLPNAVQATGSTGSDSPVISVASAVMNPQQTYALSIPHGFVTITLPTTNVVWQVNGKQAAASTYQLSAATQWKVQNQKVGCNSTLNGYASLGNEYKGGNLWAAINGVPSPAHMQAVKDLAQRMAEVDQGFTTANLIQLLKQQPLVPNTFTYVVYPVFKSKDNSDPQIRVSPIDQVAAGWFNSGATADGTEQSLGKESLQDTPNSSWGQVTGKWQLTDHHVDVSGQVMWTPGTGYNQCLGALRLDRHAQVTFTGKCPK